MGEGSGWDDLAVSSGQRPRMTDKGPAVFGRNPLPLRADIARTWQSGKTLNVQHLIGLVDNRRHLPNAHAKCREIVPVDYVAIT